jgi:hypothetical protein
MTSLAFVIPWARYYSMPASPEASRTHRALGGAPQINGKLPIERATPR